MGGTFDGRLSENCGRNDDAESWGTYLRSHPVLRLDRETSHTATFLERHYRNLQFLNQQNMNEFYL